MPSAFVVEIEGWWWRRWSPGSAPPVRSLTRPVIVPRNSCAPTAAAAQDFRGTITGQVSDRTGGALPGVTVTATNAATNIASVSTTNGEGIFTIPYLTPGVYTVSAELSGFKRAVRGGLDVRIGDRVVVDLGLEVGAIEETVIVVAQSPLLELGSASAGQVIDEKRIAMMPLSDGNPFVLSRLVPGVAFRAT